MSKQDKGKGVPTTAKAKKAAFHAKHTIPSEFPGCAKGLKYDGTGVPTEQSVKQLFAKAVREKRKELMVDFKGKPTKLESDAFTAHIPDIVKALDLSCNSLISVSNLAHLSKLKYLSVAKSNVTSINLNGLNSLIGVDLSQNRLQSVPNFSDCPELQNINLSGNPLSAGFHLLSSVKALRALDLSNCKLSFSPAELKMSILDPLKGHLSLQYLSLIGNPLSSSIPDLKLFVINELPQLKFFDWTPVSKEEKVFAKEQATNGKWANQDQRKLISRASQIVIQKRASIHMKGPIPGIDTSQQSSIPQVIDASQRLTVFSTKDELDFDINALLNEDIDTPKPHKISPVHLEPVPLEPVKDDLDLDHMLEDVMSALSLTQVSSSWSPVPRPEWWSDLSDVKILQGLGQGTYGGSFLVSWDKIQSNKVVAKKLNEKNASDPISLDSFVRETGQLVQLRHANLVPVLGCGFQNTKYIFTEYLSNAITIFQLVKRVSPGPDLILHVTRSVAAGLVFLHSNGVIHGGLKTKNVFFDMTNQRVYLSDYGYMDIKDEVSAEDCALEYMAPEIVHGNPYDEKIDVYAFGLVLLSLITREDPHQGLQPSQILQLVAQGITPKLPTWPPMAVDIVRQCLSLDPADRPSTFSLTEMLSLDTAVLFPVQPNPTMVIDQQVQVSDDHEPTLAEIELEGPDAIGIGIDDAEADKLEAVWDKVEELLYSIPAKQQQGLIALENVLSTPQRIAYAASNKSLVNALIAITERTGHMGQYEVVSDAFGTIRNLGQYLEWAEQLGQSPVLYDMMFSVFEKTQDVGLSNKALSAMTTLITTYPPNANVVLKTGAWSLLLPLITEPITLQQIEVVKLIGVIVQDKNNRVEFIKKKGFPLLMEILNTTNPELKMALLETLSSFNYDSKTKEAVKALDLETKAIRMAKAQNPTLRDVGLRSLYKLAKSSKKMKRQNIMEYHQIFESVISGIDIENMSVEERQKVCLAGRFHLAVATHSFSEQVGIPGLFDMIVKWSSCEHVDVAWTFYQLVHQFVKKDMNSLRSYVNQHAALPCLFPTLRDCEPKIRTLAVEILTVICQANMLVLQADQDWSDLFGPLAAILYFSDDKDEMLKACYFATLFLEKIPTQNTISAIALKMVVSGVAGGLVQVIADTEIPLPDASERKKKKSKHAPKTPRGPADQKIGSPTKTRSTKSTTSRSKPAEPTPEYILQVRTAQMTIAFALSGLSILTQCTPGQVGVLQQADSLDVITKHIKTLWQFPEPTDINVLEKIVTCLSNIAQHPYGNKLIAELYLTHLMSLITVSDEAVLCQVMRCLLIIQRRIASFFRETDPQLTLLAHLRDHPNQTVAGAFDKLQQLLE